MLTELGIADDVLLWNVVRIKDEEHLNPDPTRAEIVAGAFLAELARGRRVLPIGGSLTPGSAVATCATRLTAARRRSNQA